MKKLKQTKGITLVTLVVTIIILLILAGISISALTNQRLFIQAQNAKNLTEQKTAEENEILTNYLEQMNAIIGGQVTETIPDGAVVTPINDITTWLKTGGISKQYSYTTIEQVIADSTCTEILLNDENAMKYLARSTEFADAICASETTMTYLGQSAYLDNTVLNSDSWKHSIKSSQYKNKVLKPIDLTLGTTYILDGCEWDVVEKYSDHVIMIMTKSRTDYGKVCGYWAGYLKNGNKHYQSNVIEEDVSKYYVGLSKIYSHIKSAEYGSKGLYLVSQNTAYNNTNYRNAIVKSCINYKSFDAVSGFAWTGTYAGYYNSCYRVYTLNYLNQTGDPDQLNGEWVVPVAFDIDIYNIKVNENMISII